MKSTSSAAKLAPGILAVMAAASGLLAQPRPPSLDFYDSRLFYNAEARPASSAAAALEPSLPAGGDPETIARAYLQDHRVAVSTLAVAHRYRSEAAGLTHLVFRREHAGIGVFEGDVMVHVAGDGRVVAAQTGPSRLGEDWTQGLALGPSLSAAEAVEAAAGRLGLGGPLDLRVASAEQGPDRRARLEAPVLREPAPARLVWFPRPQGAVLAWELFLHLDPARWYCLVVDASSGELLFSHNLYKDDRPRGKVFRAAGAPHPEAGTQSIENFTGWPSSAGDCPASIYPPQYRSGPLANRCWVTATETLGNNASACLDADGNNQCDWRASGLQAHLEFSFANSYALTGDPAPDRQAAVTNLFYWSNVLHDWLYSLGFDEASGNFQTDNFGRGGFGEDAVLADAQDGAGANNANFATPPDGSVPRLQLFLFPGNRRDPAFDGDIITHEYSHGLTLRLVGGPGGTNDLPYWQSGAMAEGWSDAYSASFTADPVMGEYTSLNPATGFRSVAYHNSPHTFGRFGTLARRGIGALDLLIDLPQLHRDGEVWATVLWDLRVALGKAVFEQLVTTALKLTPSRPSMLEARNAILQAAQAISVSQCSVWAVFASRGFGASAALNHVQAGLTNDTALSVYESWDRPAACGGSPPQTGATLFFDDMEAGPGGWTASGLWRRSSRRVGSGSWSWWYGQETTGNYATGARSYGALVSPPIPLPTGTRLMLEWDQMFRGEGFGNHYPLGSSGLDPYLNYDSGWVQVSADGGSSWAVVTTLAHNSDGLGFDHHKVDLSRFAGSTIRLRFLFDTLDENRNSGEGWFLDNVAVRVLLTGTPVLSVEPAALSFSTVVGVSPSPQAVAVKNLGDGVLSWTVAASSPRRRARAPLRCRPPSRWPDWGREPTTAPSRSPPRGLRGRRLWLR